MIVSFEELSNHLRFYINKMVKEKKHIIVSRAEGENVVILPIDMFNDLVGNNKIKTTKISGDDDSDIEIKTYK